MKLVAWDTSSKGGALVALEARDPSTGKAAASRYAGLRKVADWSLDVDATHSERLLWAIDGLLCAAHWKLEDVDVFGVGTGPGSFTGLRIGMTTARTLAHAMGKPLVGVSSLAALARPAALWLSERERTVLIAATDAAKGELFALWGLAGSVSGCVVAPEGERAGLWRSGVEEQVLRPDELIRTLKKEVSDGTKWMAIGEGRTRYADFWSELPAEAELQPPVPFLERVTGWALGLLVWEGFQAGLASPPLEVFPRYLRASDAEVKLRAGLLPPGPTRGGLS